jgi:hypothetical protein
MEHESYLAFWNRLCIVIGLADDQLSSVRIEHVRFFLSNHATSRGRGRRVPHPHNGVNPFPAIQRCKFPSQLKSGAGIR